MPIDSNKIYCPYCKAANDADAKFCEKCGKPLDRPVVIEKSSSHTKILIVVCIVLVIVLGISAGILIKNGQSTSTAQTPSNTSTQVSKSTGIPVSEVPNLAEKIYSSGDFDQVTYGSVTLDENQCIYILSKAIAMINEGKTGNIPINSYSSPDSPEGYITTTTILKSEYVDMAQRTYKWMDTNGATPNYVGISTPGVPDLSPDTMLNMLAKVLSQYKKTGELPATVDIP